QTGNHGIHHADVSMGAAAEDGAQLTTKDVLLSEAETNGAPAKEGVHFGRYLKMGKKFVAAQIECANRDGMGFQSFGDLPVGLILFLFSRERVAIDEKIFGAEQAHAFGAAVLDGIGVPCSFDIRGEKNAMAIEREGWFEQNIAQLFLQRDLLADELAVFE